MEFQESEKLCLSLTLYILFNQEIDLACDLLLHEGRSLHPGLGELLPVVVHPGQPGSLPVSSGKRRVFLTSSSNEDFFWAVSSIGFVIDAGLEKRNVSFF